MLFYIHLLQGLILLNLTNILPQGSKSEISTWVKMALFMLPVFLLFRWIVKESELKKCHYEEEKIKKGYVWLIVYIIISVTLLILLMLYKKGKL